jgi:hypothetical protein
MLPTNKRENKKQFTFFFEGKLTLTLQENHNKLFQKRNKSKQNKIKQNNSKQTLIIVKSSLLPSGQKTGGEEPK